MQFKGKNITAVFQKGISIAEVRQKGILIWPNEEPLPLPAYDLAFTEVLENSLILTWEWGENTDFVRIYRREAGGSFAPVSGSLYETSTYKNSDITRGNTYEYMIRSYNSAGYVNSEVATIPMPVLQPEAPTNLRFSNVDEDSLTLSWDAGERNDTFRVSRRVKGQTLWTHRIQGISETSFDDSGLFEDETYEFYVRAYNEVGAADSDIAEITTNEAPIPAPVAPNDFDAIWVVEGAYTALSWTAGQNIDIIKNQHKLTSSSTWIDTGSKFSGSADFDNIAVYDLEPGTYDFRLKCYGLDGSVVYSNIDQVTIETPNPELSGGEEIIIDDNKVHVFREDGVLNVTEGGQLLSVLVIAGGGGGGYASDNIRAGGGGGAGGVVYIENLEVSTGETIAVTVGSGGLGGSSGAASGSTLREAANGGNSSLGSYVSAQGGGAGGNGTGSTQPTGIGKTGGSGGGGGTAVNAGGSGISGQGHSGGNSTSTRNSGGGGGAGGPGGNPLGGETSGHGGAGLSFDIIGQTEWYGGGGAGGAIGEGSSDNAGIPLASAGGGDSTKQPRANSGGGGSGGRNPLIDAQTGAEGIVIVRYKI